MKGILRSKLVLSLAALVMIAAAIVIPLSSSITHSHAASTTTVLSENFENGAPGWTTTGFWHIQDHPETISVKSPDINPNLVTLPDPGQLPPAFGGTHAAWFGEASTGTFCGSDFNTITQTPKNGCTSTQPHSGELTSPTFSLAGATSAEVQFQAWWEIESVNADHFDLMTVEYTIDGGANWLPAGKLNPVNNPAGQHDQSYSANGIEKPAQWNQDIVDLSGAAGQSSVQIRFTFNTVDDLYQGFRGWLVDNVVISTPFVSPNPNIASLNPACVSSSASLAVTITGSHFVSGSKILLDGNDASGAVLSTQTIEFTANNLAVGNHSVQVVSPNGAKSNTATLVSALACPLPRTQLFILLQGINTSLSQDQINANNKPSFDQMKGIAVAIRKQFPNAPILSYSYKGLVTKGKNKGQLQPYMCDDTFTHSIKDDVKFLNDEIAQYPNTDIYLIGHSLGGVVAYTYLTALTEHVAGVSLPANSQLKAVVTLDSPIGGVPSGNYFALAQVLFAQGIPSRLVKPLCATLGKQALQSVLDLENVFASVSLPNTKSGDSRGANASILEAIYHGKDVTNEKLAVKAKKDLGTVVLTIGNTKDFLWDPQPCLPFLNGILFTNLKAPDFKDAQWLKDNGDNSGIYGRSFSAATHSGDCSKALNETDQLNHGLVLTNSTVITGLVAFLAPPVGGTPNHLKAS